MDVLKRVVFVLVSGHPRGHHAPHLAREILDDLETPYRHTLMMVN